MPVDIMFLIATAAFAWGLSLATYRWFAVHNGWPMGEWQAHRPGLPIAVGLFCVLFALLFAMARGGATLLILPLFGILCAVTWTALTRVGAQSALLLAPAAVLSLVVLWMAAIGQVTASTPADSASDRQSSILRDLDRGRAPTYVPTTLERTPVLPTVAPIPTPTR